MIDGATRRNANSKPLLAIFSGWCFWPYSPPKSSNIDSCTSGLSRSPAPTPHDMQLFKFYFKPFTQHFTAMGLLARLPNMTPEIIRGDDEGRRTALHRILIDLRCSRDVIVTSLPPYSFEVLRGCCGTHCTPLHLCTSRSSNFPFVGMAGLHASNREMNSAGRANGSRWAR